MLRYIWVAVALLGIAVVLVIGLRATDEHHTPSTTPASPYFSGANSPYFKGR